MLRPPLRSTLFPYTTLFRSVFELSKNKYFALLASTILSISPIHILTSRMVYEANISLFLYFLYWILRSEEHTSELQSQFHLVCRLLLEKKNKNCFLSIISMI